MLVEGGSVQGHDGERGGLHDVTHCSGHAESIALPAVWGAAGGRGCWGDLGPSGQHRQASFFLTSCHLCDRMLFQRFFSASSIFLLVVLLAAL